MNGDPTLYLLSAADTMLLDISTCDAATNAKTVLAIIDADTLAPIRRERIVACAAQSLTLSLRCTLVGVHHLQC